MAAHGKTAVVIGATNGVGWHSALALARAGAARLFLVGRSAAKGEHIQRLCREAANGVADVVFLAADLTLMAEVRRVAAAISGAVGETAAVHILINSAGVITRTPTKTAEGIEASFAVNYLQRFLFAQLLQPLLAREPHARVVVVSAPSNHWATPLDFDDLANAQASLVPGIRLLKIAQKCNDILVPELDRRVRAAGLSIDVFEIHPGLVDTGIHVDMGAVRYLVRFLLLFVAVPIDRSGDAPVAIATDAKYAGQGGASFNLLRKLAVPADITAEAAGKRLWEMSVKLTTKA